MKNTIIKKTIIVMVTLSLGVSLIGCGKKKDSSTQITKSEETTEKETLPVWEIIHSTDEFGDVDESQSVLRCNITGTFSNSATSNSKFTGYVFSDDTIIIAFRIFEYGKTKPFFYSDDELILKYKIDDEVTECKLIGTDDKDLLIKDHYSEFKSCLKEGKDISCVIYIGSSKYNFKVYAGNYKKLSESLD